MSYLVTGGAGFIGSHVVDTLVKSGEKVRVVDNLSTGHRENLSQHAGGAVEFIEADLADAAVAASAVDGVDHVIHIAAIPSVPRSVKNPIASHRANVDATILLLDAARQADVTRVVFASSSSVYGNSPTLPKHEKMPTNPLSPYALQKLMGEQYMQLYFELYGLETVSLRFFNVFGPRQDPSSPYSGVISLFTAALSEGRQPTVYGDGEQTRDFTYVSDVATGVISAATGSSVAGRAINLAPGGRVSLNRLFETLKELIGAGASDDVEPLYSAPREGDVRDSQADNTLARDLLDFDAKVELEEGLRRTLDWYRTTQS
jgi:UDP-glucose 4-epimerase